MIDVEETLRRLRDAKRAENIVPDAVLYTDLRNDIMRQVREELNAMHADGKISVNNTLNNKSINLV